MSAGSSKLTFVADYDKRGQASCKRCKQKISKGSFRIAKISPNPFTPDSDMKQWFHPKCLFESFTTARATTSKITCLADIDNVDISSPDDRQLLQTLIAEMVTKTPTKAKVNPTLPQTPSSSTSKHKIASTSTSEVVHSNQSDCVDKYFSSFCHLCDRIAAESSLKTKTSIVRDFLFRSGQSGRHGFCGDVFILMKLLLPGEKGLERVYNINNKQLLKVFSELLQLDYDAMLETANEHGDVSQVIADYFEQNKVLKPAAKSTLTLESIEAFLESMTNLTKYEDQLSCVRKLCKECRPDELKYVIRLLKKDLRMNARASNILAAISENAYDAFQHSRDLRAICNHINTTKSPDGSPGLKKDLSVKASLMNPIQPMLAEACKSIEFAFSRCPKGMWAEIKYDGERVQVHHAGGNKFSYYSRSLKPVVPHKVSYLSDYIPKAFPGASDLILDGEIVLVDTNTHLPLPFGTLGVHKKAQFKNAQVCMFVFDILHLNGKSLMNQSISDRRSALKKVMTEIPDRVVLSETHDITTHSDLQNLLEHVFTEGLEGLVLKPVDSRYEPGKRHWLKMKKDYLDGGSMADTADLVVLGAYFGTGNKGGLMSVFLMGVHDAKQNKFLTVTKCGNGLDDKTLDKLQKDLDVIRINKDLAKVPSWLSVKSGLVPDFVVKDPKKSPVWEITGAEFSRAEIHTADGISIRFPRVTKIRADKDWKTATNLDELKKLQENSRQQGVKLGSSEKLKKNSPTSEDSIKSPPESTIKVKRKLFGPGEEEETETKSDNKKSSAVISPPKKNKQDVPSSSRSNLDWNPCDIFLNCHFYFDPDITDSAERSALQRSVIAHGASSVSGAKIGNNVTHYIVPGKCSKLPSNIPHSVKCVKVDWIYECVKAKILLDESPYSL